MARPRSILTFRSQATVLVLVSMIGASLGHVEVMRDCAACPLRAATTGEVSQVGEHDCCTPAAGDQEPNPAQREKDQPGRCPVTCGSCCLPQGRTIAADAAIGPLDLAAAVGAEPAFPPTLVLPAGVGRSVFHPPRT